jgi:hypothetical protein
VGWTCLEESKNDQGTPQDEPYFIISVDTGNGSPVTKKFGPFENTNKGSTLGIGEFLVKDIAPNPLAIRAFAYENDRGNADETLDKLQKQLVELSKQAEAIASASGAAAADGAGVGTVAGASSLSAIVAGPLGAIVALGIVTVLDLGDDFIADFETTPFNTKIRINGGDDSAYELVFDVHVTEFDPVTI